MNLAFFRLSKRQLNLVLLLATVLFGIAVIQTIRYGPDYLFYRKGLFVKYHDYMTPDSDIKGEQIFAFSTFRC